MLCHGCHSILRCPLSFKHAGYFEHGTIIHCFGFSNLAFSFAREAYFACCHNQRILPLCSWLAVYIREHSSGQWLTPLPAIRFADLQPPGSSCSLISMLNLFVLGSQPSDWYKKSHPSSTNTPYLQLRLSIQSAVLEKIIIFLLLPILLICTVMLFYPFSFTCYCFVPFLSVAISWKK